MLRNPDEAFAEVDRQSEADFEKWLTYVNPSVDEIPPPLMAMLKTAFQSGHKAGAVAGLRTVVQDLLKFRAEQVDGLRQGPLQ